MPTYGAVQLLVANPMNLAPRRQLKRVVVPGGFWREMDYGGAGWLVRREVQVASGSEVTTYTYDAWGRLRLIDYPRSADVSMSLMVRTGACGCRTASVGVSTPTTLGGA